MDIRLLALLAISVLGIVPFWSSIFAASPLRTLRRIARRFDTSHSVGYSIATNARVTSEELDAIATDSNQYLRCLVAAHPRASHGTLRRLASDSSHMVRLKLLANPQTPEEVSALVALEMMVAGSLKR